MRCQYYRTHVCIITLISHLDWITLIGLKSFEMLVVKNSPPYTIFLFVYIFIILLIEILCIHEAFLETYSKITEERVFLSIAIFIFIPKGKLRTNIELILTCRVLTTASIKENMLLRKKKSFPQKDHSFNLPW